MRVNVGLEGLEKAVASFERLKSSVQAKVLVAATKAGAEVMAERARELAPRDTGRLAKRGIRTRVTVRKKDYGETSVGHTRANFYGAIQEVGAAPHAITVTNKATGRKRKVQHPGHKAQPHLLPAYDEQKAAAEKVATVVLRDEILKAAR